ncbi:MULTISPECIES: serine/threonine-protein kinase [Streptomyces]|uniref:non-specific serine/threonine protein kinase n=1 Tax=Streptomyces bottropensis ATCC 25435 TaxID=1054862 RepID=M3FH33_9ACTN|nr:MULTISPECIES: serine/threonine-protein kinase [Streptomyces]EMF51314.1 serine/threonine protein kinase [Streptomyces bottropensis ATCC 25435]MZD20664.1 protein kinase [Streptomyces sp. SID5476]
MAVSEEPGSERVIAGRYRLLTPLGEGGMGTVWRARDEVLHREVAVKEVKAPGGIPVSDVERMYARLEREAWAAARVANRNVVTVYDVAMEDGRPWIVMELVRGVSLADLLDAEGPIGPQRAAHIGAEVLSALRAAHEAGVLHRDVKPANVLMSNDGRVVLTDFGIATVEGSSALTMTGEVIGSPEFLAPERALGRAFGPESDLWSLGVLLYAAVEGNSPFRQNTPLSTLRAVVDEELVPPHRAGPLAPVIEGLLRKDPADRMPAEQAERDLRIIGAGGTPSGTGGTRSGTLASAPYDPTVAAFPAAGNAGTGRTTNRYGAPTPPRPVPAAATHPSAVPAGGRDRNRRALVFLVAGIAAIALAVAGLTYALVNRDDGGKNGNPTNGAGTVGGTDGGTADGGTGEEEPGGGATEDDSETPSETPEQKPTTKPPAQSVDVTVTGANTDYSGTCPPPDDQVPNFTATFTVGSVPVDVQYRWVAKNGQLDDTGWKTLSFSAGGEKTKRDQVVVSTNGSHTDEISVEVRGPVSKRSNAVAFSVTCETEAPTTGGTSPGDDQENPGEYSDSDADYDDEAGVLTGVAPYGAVRPRS